MSAKKMYPQAGNDPNLLLYLLCESLTIINFIFHVDPMEVLEILGMSMGLNGQEFDRAREAGVRIAQRSGLPKAQYPAAFLIILCAGIRKYRGASQTGGGYPQMMRLLGEALTEANEMPLDSDEIWCPSCERVHEPQLNRQLAKAQVEREIRAKMQAAVAAHVAQHQGGGSDAPEDGENLKVPDHKELN